jgi:hypothetical protein
MARLSAAVEQALLLLHDTLDRGLVHEAECHGQRRDVFAFLLVLLLFQATSDLLTCEQVETNGNLAEQPVLRMHQATQYMSTFSIS